MGKVETDGNHVSGVLVDARAANGGPANLAAVLANHYRLPDNIAVQVASNGPPEKGTGRYSGQRALEREAATRRPS